MKKQIQLFICLVLLSKSISSQDLIIFKNGNESKVKVKEVGPTTISYLNYTNLDGPIYTELKSSIFMIKYENGTKDVFNETASVAEPIKKAQVYYSTDPNGNKDLIITTDGETIDCVIDNITSGYVYYHVLRHGMDSKSILELSEVAVINKSGQEPINLNPYKTPKLIDSSDVDDGTLVVRKYGGPRLGMTFVGPGALEQSLNAEGKRTYFTQFGWQLEKRIFTLKNGTSGMFEFVPLIGGLDIGKFMPSFSALVGLRIKNGFEFGAGPNLAFYRGKDFSGSYSTSANFGVVLATGMSIRSGKVNFPINIAFVPSVTKQTDVRDPQSGNIVQKQYQTGFKISLLVGFNSRKN